MTSSSSSSPLIIDAAPNNLYIDHIGLGVSDTEVGVQWIKDLTGVEPKMVNPRSDQYYWSAGLHMGKSCALEIIGPNPKHKGFHPFKEVLKSIDNEKPRLLFWYLGTNKFDKAKKVIEGGERKFKMWGIAHNSHKIEEANDFDNVVEFTIGMIGPGFRSEIPNLIQWHKRPEKKMEKKCTVTSFQITSPQSKRINDLFNSLGMSPSFKVEQGQQSNLTMIFDSPKGSITLEGGGLEFPAFPRMLGTMTKLYCSYLWNGKKETTKTGT